MRKVYLIPLLLIFLASCTQVQPQVSPSKKGQVNPELVVLKERLNALESRFSSIEERVSKLEDREATNEQEIFNLKKKVEEVDKTLATITVSQEPQGGSLKEKEKKEEQEPQTVVSLSDKDLYREAFKAMDTGDLEKAKKLFEELVNQYPKSDLADNALYWIGEIYYSHNDYETAASYFEKVIKNYPGANKVPAAMLKLAMCYKGMGEYDKATELLQKVMDEYEGTPEAAIARVKLLELQKIIEMERKQGENDGKGSN